MEAAATRRPRYLEAYPRFDIVKGKAGIERGHEICHFSDNHRRTLGLARMHDVSETHFTLEYDLTSPLFLRAFDLVEFEMVSVTNKFNPHHVMLLCPSCKERKSSVVYAGTWMCATCHGLVYRSQCLDNNTRLWEEMNSLKNEVSFSKPKGMHRQKYTKLKDRYLELKRFFRGSVNYAASDDYSYIVTSSWRSSKLSDGDYFGGARDCDVG